MKIRPFRTEDAAALVDLSMACARRETDFVLNPMWQTESELFAEFDRFGIDPEEHLLVADDGRGELPGLSGYLRHPGALDAGLFCPIVRREERGRGVGGELLRAALSLGSEKLGIKLVTAGIGTRNRGGYSLLLSHGFRPVRQHFLMVCEERPRTAPPDDLGLVFGPAASDDAEAILEIYEACGFAERSLDEMRALMGDGRHFHTVARLEERVVAFAEIETHWSKRPWVAYVGVPGDLRDRGVGSTLTAWTLERQFEAGAQQALLLLSPANRTALRAYEKVGFRRHRMVDVLERGL